MSFSKIYLGAARDFEDSLRRATNAKLGPLHVAGQRVSWGILMGERVGIDLEAEARRLQEQHADQVPAQVALALVRVAQGKRTEAERHVDEARKYAGEESPWAPVLDPALWTGESRAATFTEDVPGRVYRVVVHHRTDGTAFANPGAATFVRMRSGELVYVNAVALDDAMVERIRALGEVAHLIAPAKYHSNHVPLAQRQFPKAETWGVPGHRRYPGVAHIRFDGYLDDAAPLFRDELDQVTIRGVDVGDVWLVDRASKTLLVTDAVLFAQRAPGDEPFQAPFRTFYTWAWGLGDRFGIPSYQPAMWQDIRAYQASVRRALECDFESIASCHGPWRTVPRDGKAELASGLSWFLGLSRFDAAVLLGDFVRRHPGVFARLVKEQIVARRKK